MLDTAVRITIPRAVPAQSADINAFCAELAARLRAGSHLILYGPRGAGKSTLLRTLSDQYRAIGAPCGLVPQTSGLPDLVAALAGAYPDTDVDGLGRRTAGIRLRLDTEIAIRESRGGPRTLRRRGPA